MAEKRTDRQYENRASQERPKAWAPPTAKPEPNKQPGWVYFWKRTATLNEPDPRNISMAFREGWEPVKAEEQPHMKHLSDHNSKFKGCIEIGGLLLCKAPEELINQRNEYYLNQANQQMQSVDNNLMRESDPRAPIFKEHKSSVSFGKGK